MNQTQMWKFHVDWVTPANSTFTGPTLLPISAFEPVTYQVPQQGTTRLLDTLSFRLMNLLQYRNMGSYESLWASHTVDVAGKASVRWYEVRTRRRHQCSISPAPQPGRWQSPLDAQHRG
ncbi:hypothetical protein [Candidatus Amarolinea dominans]|uniref:hypothetical protein n=1 Tax=Candidatus Amarolinea dominans TaxID=3140696 RepID=UPI00313659C5|nr:hypothetical protein [Anaerolineae bacterium]